MSRKFYYFSWLVMMAFFGLIFWGYMQIMFPYDVLLVHNIEAYNPSFINRMRYLAVIEEPFITESGIPKTQMAGNTARFQVNFIYNFGNPPEVVALLKCTDSSIFDVPKLGEVPKLIGNKGEVTSGISDYNFISERAKGKVCHLEFDAEWRIGLQSIHKKLKTDEFYVE